VFGLRRLADAAAARWANQRESANGTELTERNEGRALTLLLLLHHQDLRGALLGERRRRGEVVAPALERVGGDATALEQVLLERGNLLPESTVLVPARAQLGTDGIEEAIALGDVKLEGGDVLCSMKDNIRSE
jgi:hypothetical protein